jgi:hypothetical protein
VDGVSGSGSECGGCFDLGFDFRADVFFRGDCFFDVLSGDFFALFLVRDFLRWLGFRADGGGVSEADSLAWASVSGGEGGDGRRNWRRRCGIWMRFQDSASFCHAVPRNRLIFWSKSEVVSSFGAGIGVFFKIARVFLPPRNGGISAHGQWH